LQLVKTLKALADNTRLKIVLSLLKKEHAATELVPIIKKAQPTISLNLKVLENANIITSRRSGKFIFYKIKDKNIITLIQDVKVLKALADETRLKIVLSLLKGEKAATKLVSIVGKAQPTISLNLKVLENANIIESRRQGKFVFYKIKNKKMLRGIK